MQVIRQLRNGVKLKSASGGESARKPYEYELTPYEMMMDDIRSRRYKLRQVMVDGTIPPRVKKDAHAVILEFIRSRPPLRKVNDHINNKSNTHTTYSFIHSFHLIFVAHLFCYDIFVQASERKLRPLARRVSTPVELLMESIRQHDSKELRPTRCLLVNRTGESIYIFIFKRERSNDGDFFILFVKAPKLQGGDVKTYKTKKNVRGKKKKGKKGSCFCILENFSSGHGNNNRIKSNVKQINK